MAGVKRVFITRESIPQEDTIISEIYALYNKASKYKRQKLIKMQK